jgi:hypothetical protein
VITARGRKPPCGELTVVSATVPGRAPPCAIAANAHAKASGARAHFFIERIEFSPR